MANSFLEYYRFNTEIASGRTILQKTKKYSKESFQPYQVTHFASLILIGECIDEGIRRKKTMDAEFLSSMVEQQVNRMTGCKTKEDDVHMVDNASERPRGVASTYATPYARPYQQQA